MLCCLFPLISYSLLIFIVVCLIVRFLSRRQPLIKRHETERYYFDSSSGEKFLFPVAEDEQLYEEMYLSIIIPAYNEQFRLPKMLDETFRYLEKRSLSTSKSDISEKIPYGEQFTYEVIIVDDGSNDDTTKVALEYNKKYGSEKVRVLTLYRNRGKGGAVRLGMLSSRGKLLLLVDADGATTFSDIEKLENYLYHISKDDNHLMQSIAIGSRKHLEKESIAERSFFRTILMYCFHFIVWFFTVKTIGDTQCGFKLFGRYVGRQLFRSMHIERWAFDVELIYLAERLDIRIGEIAVQWKEIEGSKIVPIFSWLQMGRDVLKISFMYNIGAWAFPKMKLCYK